MTAQRLTSIITVSYQTGPVLDRALTSFLASEAPVEVICVDNGNPPEVLAKLQALAQADARFKLITGQGNVGFAVACNLGARAATGEALLFLNPDSILPPDALGQVQAEASQLRSPYMIGVRLLDGAGKTQRGCRRALLTPLTAFIEALHLHRFFPKVRLNFHEEPLPEKTVPIPAISGAFMFLPRADFWSINGFDEGYFLHVEDLDLCYRFRQSGGEIYFVPNIAVTHIGGTSKATSEFLEKNKARGFIRYFHQNFESEVPAPMLWLLDGAVLLRMAIKIVLVRAKAALASKK